MKPPRYNKIVGLALGEQSLLAAEVTSGEKLEAKRLAEFIYPAGVSFAQPAELGKALGEFLKANNFSAKSAVVGIPAKWLAVKSKDVPPADPTTLANILRLQAEGDFSAELKDLVYDYAGVTGYGDTTTAMVFATPQKHLTAAAEMCDAAGLTAVAVTPSVIALSSATSRAIGKDAMVLAVASAGTEFAAQHGASPIAMRPLRSASTGELRRAVSAVPTNGSPRELVLWDGVGVDADTLGNGLGVMIRAADLPSLGIDVAGASVNGAGRKYAAAVALAMEALGDRRLSIDFLHSRLAPPKQPLLPRWAMYAIAGVILAIVGFALAYQHLQSQESQLAADRARLEQLKPAHDAAEAFVNKVTFAQAFHSGDARYLACVRDLTAALPDDQQSYATSLQINEVTQVVKGKTIQTGQLSGRLYGKTADQQRAQMVVDAIRVLPNFTDVRPGGTQDAGRGREVSFSVTFVYRPGKG